MAIILERDTGVSGALFKLNVKMNNKYIGKIAQGEEKYFPLPHENSVLQIKQLDGKSNTLVVNDGDHVKVTNGPGLLFLFVLGVILAPLSLTFLAGTARWISSIIVILGFILILQFVNVYKLERLDDSNK